jgi:hypothetical protein
MSRDPEEEFELVKMVVETTKRYLDSLEALDDSFKGFDINSIFRELLIRIDDPPYPGVVYHGKSREDPLKGSGETLKLPVTEGEEISDNSEEPDVALSYPVRPPPLPPVHSDELIPVTPHEI